MRIELNGSVKSNMESDITPQERMNLAKAIIKHIKRTDDEAMLELGLIRHITSDAVTYTIVDKQKWFLAKIKYGI